MTSPVTRRPYDEPGTLKPAMPYVDTSVEGGHRCPDTTIHEERRLGSISATSICTGR